MSVLRILFYLYLQRDTLSNLISNRHGMVLNEPRKNWSDKSHTKGDFRSFKVKFFSELGSKVLLLDSFFMKISSSVFWRISSSLDCCFDSSLSSEMLFAKDKRRVASKTIRRMTYSPSEHHSALLMNTTPSVIPCP